jgi:hypothetical protein
MQGGELLEVPHILKQRPKVLAVLVNKGHRRGGRTRPSHGETSFIQEVSPALGVPNMTEEGHRRIQRDLLPSPRCGVALTKLMTLVYILFTLAHKYQQKGTRRYGA